MASPASHDVRVVKRSALAGVAGVGRRHTWQPRRHVSPRRRERDGLYYFEVLSTRTKDMAASPPERSGEDRERVTTVLVSRLL